MKLACHSSCRILEGAVENHARVRLGRLLPKRRHLLHSWRTNCMLDTGVGHDAQYAEAADPKSETDIRTKHGEIRHGRDKGSDIIIALRLVTSVTFGFTLSLPILLASAAALRHRGPSRHPSCASPRRTVTHFWLSLQSMSESARIERRHDRRLIHLVLRSPRMRSAMSQHFQRRRSSIAMSARSSCSISSATASAMSFFLARSADSPT